MQGTLSVYDSDHTILVPQGMHIVDADAKKAAGDAIKNEYSPDGDMQNDLVTGIRVSFKTNGQFSPYELTARKCRFNQLLVLHGPRLSKVVSQTRGTAIQVYGRLFLQVFIFRPNGRKYRPHLSG